MREIFNFLNLKLWKRKKKTNFQFWKLKNKKERKKTSYRNFKIFDLEN